MERLQKKCFDQHTKLASRPPIHEEVLVPLGAFTLAFFMAKYFKDNLDAAALESTKMENSDEENESESS